MARLEEGLGIDFDRYAQLVDQWEEDTKDLRSIHNLMLAGKENMALSMFNSCMNIKLKQQRDMAVAQKKAFDRALLDGLAKVKEAEHKQREAERKFNALFQSIHYSLKNAERC